ncbi:uncharacterized protein MYCFIDRAFT_173259 [Pseudocercospora fijiensis CIRAD86]|uniref:Uncharacterized protein n=1 Tax=Pseudocercospora fijiensis (strain CIRAD86) TaxID=383855 RepID=M3B4G9_PSEFD|nr:uncharacterized protein MYCFIDRAFT_173259 [Pseudocercospora fijiensis CIRAD86]EME84237.1 hypothetical protein MYCFIDRAFT_173259 [Pseudocercospora fijiensis CIRAD86]
MSGPGTASRARWMGPDPMCLQACTHALHQTWLGQIVRIWRSARRHGKDKTRGQRPMRWHRAAASKHGGDGHQRTSGPAGAVLGYTYPTYIHTVRTYILPAAREGTCHRRRRTADVLCCAVLSRHFHHRRSPPAAASLLFPASTTLPVPALRSASVLCAGAVSPSRHRHQTRQSRTLTSIIIIVLGVVCVRQHASPRLASPRTLARPRHAAPARQHAMLTFFLCFTQISPDENGASCGHRMEAAHIPHAARHLQPALPDDRDEISFMATAEGEGRTSRRDYSSMVVQTLPGNQVRTHFQAYCKSHARRLDDRRSLQVASWAATWEICILFHHAAGLLLGGIGATRLQTDRTASLVVLAAKTVTNSPTLSAPATQEAPDQSLLAAVAKRIRISLVFWSETNTAFARRRLTPNHLSRCCSVITLASICCFCVPKLARRPVSKCFFVKTSCKLAVCTAVSASETATADLDHMLHDTRGKIPLCILHVCTVSLIPRRACHVLIRRDPAQLSAGFDIGGCACAETYPYNLVSEIELQRPASSMRPSSNWTIRPHQGCGQVGPSDHSMTRARGCPSHWREDRATTHNRQQSSRCWHPLGDFSLLSRPRGGVKDHTRLAVVLRDLLTTKNSETRQTLLSRIKPWKATSDE